MPWAAAAVIGGALITANAAGDASDAQVGAADRGVAEQRRQFEKVQEMLSPFVNAATGTPQGWLGGQKLVDTSSGVPSMNGELYATNPAYRAAWDQALADHRAHFEGRGYSYQSDASAIEQYLRSALAPQFAQEAASPTGPKGALPAYQELIGLNGDAAQGAAIDRIKSGAQFGSLAQQGEDAILQNASATGGLRGGNTQGALADFRSNLLSSLIDKQLGRYGGLVQMGQNSAAGVGTAAMATGQGISGLMQQAGAAQAGGIVAGSNAITGAIGNIGGFMAGRGGQSGGGGTPYNMDTWGQSTAAGGSGFGSGIVFGNQPAQSF